MPSDPSPQRVMMRDVGKTDEEIIVEMIKDGLTRQQAIDALGEMNLRRNRRLGRLASALLAIGLVSIALYVGIIIDMVADARKALILTPLFIVIILVPWILFYRLGLKKEHPRAQRLFVLYTSVLIGNGIAAFLQLAVFSALSAFGVAFSTPALIIILSACVCAGMVTLDRQHSAMGARLLGRPRKPMEQSVISAIIVFVVFVILLASLLLITERKAQEMAQERERTMAATVNDALRFIDGERANVANAALKAKLDADYNDARANINAANAPQEIDAIDALTDRTVVLECGKFEATVLASITVSKDIELLREYSAFKAATPPAPDLALYQQAQANQETLTANSLPSVSLRIRGFGVRYAAVDDLQSCFDDLQAKADAPEGLLPQRPDLNDSAQRELVSFVIWRAQR